MHHSVPEYIYMWTWRQSLLGSITPKKCLASLEEVLWNKAKEETTCGTKVATSNRKTPKIKISLLEKIHFFKFSNRITTFECQNMNSLWIPLEHGVFKTMQTCIESQKYTTAVSAPFSYSFTRVSSYTLFPVVYIQTFELDPIWFPTVCNCGLVAR